MEYQRGDQISKLEDLLRLKDDSVLCIDYDLKLVPKFIPCKNIKLIDAVQALNADSLYFADTVCWRRVINMEDFGNCIDRGVLFRSASTGAKIDITKSKKPLSHYRSKVEECDIEAYDISI